MAKDFISDEEMAKLEQDKGKDFISDEEMAVLEKQGLPKYDPMQALSDAMRGVGQGVTFGHLPQVVGAAKSLSVSGPEYEAAKQQERAALEAAQVRNPALVFGGELVGGTAIPGIGMGKVASKSMGALKGAGIGALTSAAQSPGGDVTWESLDTRLKNALLGAAMGGALGGVAGSAGAAAERRAFKALGPGKRDVLLAQQRGDIQGLGRSLLDEGIIGNIPSSREGMLERISAAKEKAGASKGAIIDELASLEEQFKTKFGQEPGLVPAGAVSATPEVSGGIDLNAIREMLRGQVAPNINISDAPQRMEKIEELIQNIGRGKKSLPLKEADIYKTAVGKEINYSRLNPLATAPDREAFDRSLYSALNKGVDDAAEVLAKTYKPELSGELAKSKKLYSKLAAAEGILGKKVSGDIANRLISPSSYGSGAAVLAGSLAKGGAVGPAAAAGAAAAGVNQFLLQYGNQLSAKQLDNLSRLLKTKGVFSGAAGAGAVATGAIERRLKALEE